jgi:hypothetical protein
MTKPIASQRPRPEALIIRPRVAEAIVKAVWEIPPQRIRELSGLPELSDELIAHRIDMHMQHVSPDLYVDGARKLRKRKRKP